MKVLKCFSLLKRTQQFDITVIELPKQQQPRTQCQSGEIESNFKCRHAVALMGFAVFAFLNIHRMNMNVSIVAMVNPSSVYRLNASDSQSCPELLDEGIGQNLSGYYDHEFNGDFTWSPEVQGYILSSGFIGYFLTQFIAGKLSEVYGCKWIIFVGVFTASATTFITPFVSWWNVNLLILVQTLRGMGQGVYQPAVSVLMANWFPVMERGSIFAFVLAGNGVGALVGGLVSGYLCEASFAGWPYVFYLCGIAGIIVSFLIAMFLYENPGCHPNISERELKFILSHQENVLSHRRPNPPWRSIFTSVPVYALAFAAFGQNWAGSHFLAVHPTFLGTILHFPISQNGLLTSVPFILQTIFTLIASGLSNIMTKNKYISIDQTRKFWNFMACLGYSSCVLGIYFAQCNRTISVAFSFLAMSFIGFAYAGSMIVPTDMTPTFAGSVMGIVCTFGTTAGFVLPIIVGFLTEEKATLEQWNKVMFISIGVVLSSGIVFNFFGSAKIQQWNYVKEEKDSRDEEQNENKLQTHL